MIEAVKGTRDILPDEAGRWQFVEAQAREVFGLYGFREIRTPIFESTDLFARGVGEGTDIVAKEMYTFLDRKGRSLTLRPENTAPVARAYLEHGMQRGSDLTRLYYIGPMFRYERPQKGRMRQFSQIGVEALGSEHPAVDAETLQMLMVFLERLGLGANALLLNSVGCENCRPAYREILKKELAPFRDRLDADCRRRLETNPLRVFDCKMPEDQALIAAHASPILDHLCADCRRHLDGVRSHLDRLAVRYTMDPRLVRGLDYYRRTTFEVTLPTLGAQSALLGGGRYDGLVQELGGPAVPGFGFAVGEDRLVMSLPPDRGGADATPDAVAVILGEEGVGPALDAARRLREAGMTVVVEPFPDRSAKAQLRRANDLKARAALLLGSSEAAAGTITVKRLSDGLQKSVPAQDLAATLKEMLHG